MAGGLLDAIRTGVSPVWIACGTSSGYGPDTLFAVMAAGLVLYGLVMVVAPGARAVVAQRAVTLDRTIAHGTGRGQSPRSGRGSRASVVARLRNLGYDAGKKRGSRRSVTEMGWDKGGLYYTRSRRVNGHVVREYIGGGPVGTLAAELDARERDMREADHAVIRAEREELASLDTSLNELNELADELVRAVLAAAGFHQHKRGAWRKKRG